MEQRPIRVTHILHTMAYGGIETVIINWLKAMPRSDVDVQLVVFKNPDDSEQPFVKEAEKAGLTVEYVEWSRAKPVFRAARELRGLLDKHGTQILHAHNTYAEVVAWLAAKKSHIKLMSTFYVWDMGFGFKRLVLQKVSAWLARRYDRLSAQCEKTMRDGAKWGVPSEGVVILPSGYEVPEASKLTEMDRQQLRASRGAGPGDLIVCNVARLYPEKGHDRLLRLWPSVVEAVPNAKLWIYGVGPLEQELRKLHEELGLSGSVLFIGFAHDLMDELSTCDVQVHPSFNEGVPLAICAGMASGLPIVSTAVGGIPEVIEDGKSGYLVDVEDIEGLIHRLVSLLRDGNHRRKIGQAATRFIQDEYSLQRAVAILANEYMKLLGPSGGAAQPRTSRFRNSAD